MKRLVLTLICLALPAVVSAQAPSVQPPVTAIRIVITGGASPVTNDLPIGKWVCGQTPGTIPPGTAVNPNGFQYTDPSASGKVCKYVDDGTGPLTALPFGGTVYTATAAPVNSVGVAPASNPSNPFSHPGVAPTTALTGFAVVP